MQLQLYGNKIWVYSSPIDFRCSIDGITSLIANQLKLNPQSGIYLFYNKGRDKIKCLSWHKNGFVLLYKRLESGKFKFNFNKSMSAVTVTTTELTWLLAGLEWQAMRDWKHLNYEKFS